MVFVRSSFFTFTISSSASLLPCLCPSSYFPMESFYYGYPDPVYALVSPIYMCMWFFLFFFILGFCCFSFCTSSIFFPALVIRLYVLVRRLHVFIHHYDYSNTSIFVIVSFSVINVVVFWFVILTFGFDIFYFFGLQRVSMIPSICKM